ncbi:Lactose permease [compost metagenome]
MNSTHSTLQAVTPFKRLFAGIAFSNASYYIATVPPMILLLTLKLQIIAPQSVVSSLATVISIGSIVSMLAHPIAGAVGDRTRLKFGRRRTWILLGSILGGASLLALGFAQEVWQVVLLWSCVQMFFAFTMASNAALLAEQVEESRRGSLSGIIGALPPLGALVGITLVNSMSGLSEPIKWALLGIIGVIGPIIAVIMIRDTAFSGSKKKVKFSFSRIIPSPRKYPAFAYAWLARFLVLFIPSISSFGTLFVSERFHFTPTELTSKITLISAISTILSFTFSIVGGMLSDYFKRQKPFVIGSGILMGLALIVQVFSPNFTIYLICAVFSAIGSGMFYGVDMALLTRVLPNKEDAAKDLGILNMTNSLPQAIVPAMLPLLIGIGGYELAFSVIAAIGILGALAVIKVPEMSTNIDNTDLSQEELDI